ncbi:alpha/beta hydrolase fold domain-containing protein [Sulfitobacter sp. D35]|uniref:alpha/beta hydrolase fold domain-containing protein n=1 Tax=Sulfitobacter sp. D35 TaxID=3083252 RepID=UPI00296E88D7|nr:alpha/beta hydrolase fold domain-containing protein [Sulfitobacter sp. D35]MDW4499009.1 alpha/beta hydrolase fold domain-containing protein [Sulfitobacter sp. D35]
MKPHLRLLNAGLRRFERPHLLNASPEKLRASFEFKARWLFPVPRGTRRTRIDLAGIDALRIEGPWVDDSDSVLLYFHGGGYVFGSPNTHAALVARLARAAGVAAVLPWYRLAPEHPFPAACDDVMLAWHGLVSSGVPAERIVLGGDSAGGGLALSLLGTLIARGEPRPRGLFAFSPLTDMGFTGGSIIENADRDPVMPADRIGELQIFYLSGQDPQDPRASPLHASFEGASPVWLCVGDTEILRDDTLRIAERMRVQGVDVTLETGRDLPHVWPLFGPLLPEANATIRRLAEWIRRLRAPQGGS